jgi:hypothetical protein
MGFRDLSNFNKALLAKQFWRLLKSPDSLTAKIIRAKYYPRGTLMEAKLGSKPSFAWRSIYGARELIEAGLFWRIGNGQQVTIWGEIWVPLPVTYRIHSPPQNMDPNSKVHQLINWEMKWWDHEKLVNLFTKEEVAAIKTIPISHTNQPDCQIWRCTGSRIF